MAIVKYDPFDLRGLWRWPAMVFDEDEGMGMGDGMDIFETENEIVVRANVAGVDPKNVDITFEKGVVWIRANEEKEESEGRKYFKKAVRSYSYKIAVPGNIDMKTDPEARVTHGVIELRFKKAEEAKPRKIAIK